mgnify:CR=1 FL=1
MAEISYIGRSQIHKNFCEKEKIEPISYLTAPWNELVVYEKFAPQFFGEHCTECSAPDCHYTCDLFERGVSGFCRRFEDGINYLLCDKSPDGYVFELICRPWGMILAVGHCHCLSTGGCRRLAKKWTRIRHAAYTVEKMFYVLPGRLQWRISDKIRGFLNRIPRFYNVKKEQEPDVYLMLIGNPHGDNISIEVIFAGFGDSQRGRSYRFRYDLKSGWNTIKIPVSEIGRVIDFNKLFRAAIVPLISSPKMLQFAFAGFAIKQIETKKKIKLLICDLDNTLWDGILVEDGASACRVKQGVPEVLKELDRRGILLSIASQNNFEDAKRKLMDEGLWDLFVYPQVNWGPKSESVKKIISRLNIGNDAVAFIDDSDFQREEVARAVPGIKTYRCDAVFHLLNMPEFNSLVTEEARARRSFYQKEMIREEAYSGFTGSYDEFLKSCSIKLRIKFGMPDEIETKRVEELVQRTNQLNFSGNHYKREELYNLIKTPDILPAIMSAEDKFGEYGIIGFAIVEEREGILIIKDMMFSCRVMGKKLDLAFINKLKEKCIEGGVARIGCVYNRTERNTPAMEVLGKAGFEEVRKGWWECKDIRSLLADVPVQVECE